MEYQGHCHCGQISYAVSDPIIKTSACDCEGCTRATGTLSAPFVTFLRANLSVTKGQPASYRAPSGEACDAFGDWHFCSHCGSPLWWLANKGDEVDIFAGSLVDRSIYAAEGSA